MNPSRKASIEIKKNIVIRFLAGIIKLLFNKIFYVSFAFLAQLLFFALMGWFFAGYSRYFFWTVQIISYITAFYIVNRRINPSYKLAWTITILCIPVFGLFLYLVFGKSRIAARIENLFEKARQESSEILKEKPEVRKAVYEENPSVSAQSSYISNVSGYPIHTNTIADYFQVGDDMFPVLIRELKNARKYIFIEYFIINDGLMWESVLSILEEKVKEGVDVRLIYDGFGCLSTLPAGYYKKLRSKGIQCVVFNPFRPILNVIQNNRDHRKLCIIDGYVGFTGGINLSDEYINKTERFGHWKDTAVMLKGEAVMNMTVMFLHMWKVITAEEAPINYMDYLPEKSYPANSFKHGFVQPFCDSPLDNEIVGENVYLNIINKAKRYVYICTPYLIIDNEMMTALCLASKSGVDIRIMTPSIPDKKLVFLLTQSYYEQLLEAGVRIYEYIPGFLHAKSFVCDDELAVVGTINLDYRSLYLHFEDGVWIYRNQVIHDIRTDFENTMKYCDPICLDTVKKRGIFVRGLQSILRLVAPML